MKIGVFAAVTAALLTSTSILAATYSGALTTGTITTVYSIVTDGTLGVLNSSNILSSSGVVVSGAAAAFFDTGNYNVVGGNAFTATETDLLFDSGIDGTLYIGQLVSETFTGLCLSGGTASCTGGPGPSVLIAVSLPGDFDVVPSSGRFVVASTTATAAAAPEPASWAMLVTGFGLTGAALRRRKALAAA